MTRALQFYLILFGIFAIGFSRADGQDVKTGRYYYIGAVGNRAAQLDMTFNGRHIDGSLFFINSNSVRKVSGIMQKSGHVNITVKGTKHSGKLDGKTVNGHTEINGKWVSANSKDKHSFHFIKVAEYLKSSIQQGGHLSLSARYPYFVFNNRTGHEINSKLQDSVLDRQQNFLKDGQKMNGDELESNTGWKQNITYEITYFSSNLISIAGNIYIYTGGAHGINNPLTNNFYIDNGHVKQLKLSDLFLSGSTYEEHLSRICMKNLYHKGATWVKDGEVSHLAGPDMHHFTISPKGLTFYFPPYIVGPYSDGSFTVVVPFDSLRDYLDKDGPLQDLLSVPRN